MGKAVLGFPDIATAVAGLVTICGKNMVFPILLQLAIFTAKPVLLRIVVFFKRMTVGSGIAANGTRRIAGFSEDMGFLTNLLQACLAGKPVLICVGLPIITPIMGQCFILAAAITSACVAGFIHYRPIRIAVIAGGWDRMQRF